MNKSRDPSTEYHPTIHDMDADDRPRERLRKFGERSLSSAELLAIIMRTGTGGENVVRLAERLLAFFNGLPGLASASITELKQVKGIGEAKAIEIKAAMELGRRLLASAPEERLKIRSPQDAANLLLNEMALLEQENMRVLLLDTRNQMVGSYTIYVGSLNTSVVRIGELFKPAIKDNAAAIIVAHNHPSGDPSPSPEDVNVTRQVVQAGKLLDIDVLDHIIIGNQRYVSLKERGLGFD